MAARMKVAVQMFVCGALVVTEHDRRTCDLSCCWAHSSLGLGGGAR